MEENNKPKKALIDIDNTLWNFSDELYNQLKLKYPDIPAPENWFDWNFWEGYCKEDDFWNAVNYIHLNQDKYIPFPEAKNFLKSLKNEYFHIVIMSYRIPESYKVTADWLKNNELVFDELQFPENKSDLFDDECNIVVDDEPKVLEKALKKGIKAVGLKMPPNRDGQNDCQLFKNLGEIQEFIFKQKRAE